MNIGIDWDGTADRYGEAIGKIALLCDKKVIITLNNTLTVMQVVATLNPRVSDYIIEVMPDSAFSSGEDTYESIAKWKLAMCRKHKIDVMIDDEPANCMYLMNAGVACIKCDGDWELTENKFEVQ